MNVVSRRVAVVVCLLAWPSLVQAQTVEEVLEKSLTAVGGRAALAKLKSRLVTGTIVLSTPGGDITGTIEILAAPPNKQRTLIKADLTALGAGQLTVDQRFNGTAGYVLDNLQGNRDITGNQLDNMRNGSFPHPFLTYKEMGTVAKLAGKEKAGDRDAYVVVFEPTSGSLMRQYIDAETYLPLKFTSKVNVPQLGQDFEQTTEFLDYREVDGIKMPFKIKTSSDIQNIVITATKVEHNVAVDEKLFSKPAQH